jgi:hypothetical protein
VKLVAQHYAGHERDEVKAFGYDRTLHKLTDFVEEEFFRVPWS